MQPEHASEHQPSFVLRVWPDEPTAGQTRWRGEVLHTASGTRKPFVDLRGLTAFVQRWTDGSDPPSVSEPSARGVPGGDVEEGRE